MSLTLPTSCRASARIDFPALDIYFADILDAIATHDMTVVDGDAGYRVISAFGQALLQKGPGQLDISVEAADGQSLNRMKHALAGPIGFIAARERLVIRWVGDRAGLTSLGDLRILTVDAVMQLTPGMRRVVLCGQDLAHLDRPDQMHCRLIFAPQGEAAPAWPALDDQGHVVWPGGKMPTRVYTIRHIDAKQGRLTIDFALHAQPGPATAWALAAAPGDRVGVVGPAAGGPKPAAFYVLAGDESGLPGIARILASLPQAAQGLAFVEVRDSAETLPLARPPGVALHWLYRQAHPAGTTTLLPDAIRGVAWPADLSGVFFWGGCEHRAFRDIHRHLKHTVGLSPAQQVLYSHWHRRLSEEQIIEVGAPAYLPE